MEIPQIISPDGYIQSLDAVDEQNNRRDAVFRFPDVSDYIREAVADKKPFCFTGRSGNAQIGINTVPRTPETLPEVDGRDVVLAGQISCLNPLLGNVLHQFHPGDEIGRLVIMDPDLRIDDVRHYLHKRLFVGRRIRKGYYDRFEVHTETDPLTGRTCDYIMVELEPYQYRFEPHAINPSSINAVIKKGRIALNRIRSRIPMNLKTALLKPGELFVGAVKVSLGDIYAVIDSDVVPENVGITHLSARVLDPFRTFRDRQVELYNSGEESIPLSHVKIKIRFFRTRNPLTVPLEKSKVKDGYRLSDLLTHAEVSNLLQTLQPDTLGMILNKGNFVAIPSALDPHGEAQLEMIRNAVVRSTQRRSEPALPKEVNGAFKNTLEKLSVLGGINSRVFIGSEFPDSEVLDTLRRSGLRTFLIQAQTTPFEDDYVKKMIRLTHAPQSDCEFLRYDPDIDKLYTFYHGCFMEPDDRERFDRVRYWFAFYGSHTQAADNRLTIDLLNRLAGWLGDEMGIVHGGGPGLMKEANDLARMHNIMSVGVAIDLEGENQASLTTCDGLIKYREGLRLARQDHIQKLSNLPVVNTGGYGSAEELAITITSMKLHETPLAPIVLLDPDNLWEDARRQTVKIAEKKYGPAFAPILIHSCGTAVEALEVLLQFLRDPGTWYARKKVPMESVDKARVKSRRIRSQTLCQDRVEVFDRPNSRLTDHHA